jgi:hypothetical protein
MAFSDDDWYKARYETLKKQKQRAKTEAEKQEVWAEIKDLQAQRKAKTGRGYGGK